MVLKLKNLFVAIWLKPLVSLKSLNTSYYVLVLSECSVKHSRILTSSSITFNSFYIFIKFAIKLVFLLRSARLTLILTYFRYYNQNEIEQISIRTFNRIIRSPWNKSTCFHWKKEISDLGRVSYSFSHLFSFSREPYQSGISEQLCVSHEERSWWNQTEKMLRQPITHLQNQR